MLKVRLFLILTVAACGGHKPVDTTPQMAMTTDNPPPADNSNMIPPEKMDEIQQDLKRKNMIVSRCLAMAMENKDVPKGTHGRISFEISIAPDGHASDVKVIKSDIQAASVIDCAKKHVQEIAFPTLPKQFETSFTFAMEAN